MEFRDKLVFLMDITKISNKELASALGVDASLISLMRTGRRKLPRNRELVSKMSGVFALRCNSDYQLHALEERIGGIKYTNVLDNQVKDAIYGWLTGELQDFVRFKDQQNNPEETVSPMTLLEEAKQEEAEKQKRNEQISSTSAATSDCWFYYDDEERVEAIRQLLQKMKELIKEPSAKPRTIYYYLEDENEWLENYFYHRIEDYDIMDRWLEAGNYIFQVFPPFLNLDDTLNQTNQWIPRFMTGRVESYYYPRTRDHLFTKSFLIIPGEVAVVSDRVGKTGKSCITLLSFNERYIEAALKEFNELVALCKPTLQCYTDSIDYRFLETEYYQKESSKMQCAPGLSIDTVSEEMIDELVANVPQEGEEYLQYMEELRSISRHTIHTLEQGNEIYDVIMLDSIEDIMAGKAEVLTLPQYDTPPVQYSPKMYMMHLENILNLSKKYPHYHVVVYAGNIKRFIMLREDEYAVILRRTEPESMLVTEQSQIVSLIQEHFLRQIEQQGHLGGHRDKMLRKIRHLCQEIRERL